MKLQRAFFVVIALVFLVSFTAAVSGVDTARQTAQVAGSGDVAPTTMAVTSYTMVNADTDQDIMTVVDGSTIDIATLGTQNFTLRADTTAGDLLPLSVRFSVNGTTNYLTNNFWPYTINQSGANDDYVPATFTLNQAYTVTATPYTQTRANGTAGTSLSINFTLIDSSAGMPEQQGDVPPPQGFVNPVNDVVLAAPVAGASVTAGQTLPMTCDITTTPDHVVWKLSYSYFYGTPTVSGNFTTLDNVSYSTGAYTQNVTIPASTPAGQLSLMCVAYFKTLSAPVTYTDDYAMHAVTVGTVAPQNATSITINSPSSMSVTKGQPFTFSIAGAPSDNGIVSVKFTASPVDGPAPIISSANFGTDNSPSFSVQAMFQQRGAYNLTAKATLSNGQTLTATKEIFAVDYPMAANGGNTQFKITSYTGCNPCNFVEDAPQTINYTTTMPAGVVFAGADIYAWGGNTEYGGTGLQFLGTVTAPNGTFNFTIAEPGTSLGQAGVNTLIIPIAFFSNTVQKNIYPVRVNSNPNENMPSIANLNIVTASGTNLGALTSGMQVNVGSQSGGLGQAISVKANPGNVSPVSVKFNLTGPSGFTAYTLCEGNAPFALFGDANNIYNTWPATMMLGAYTLLVTPYNAANCSGSAGTAISTPFVLVNNDDVTAPVAPTAVTITYRDNDEIRLSWTASASADETGYKVYRNPGSVTPLGNVTTFTDTNGITTTGSYSYTVTALDAVGNESGVSVAAPAPTLSTTFSAGASVTVKPGQTAIVKAAPDGAALGNQISGKSGTIVGTPAYYLGVTYWNVDFTTAPTTPDGWVAESALEATVVGGGSAVPTFYETKRGLTAKQLAVVCNQAYAQSCAVADYYIQQRGIPTQNKVTLNFNSVGPTQFGYTYDTLGAIIGQDILENYNGTGQNMRDYVLAQIQTAYTAAGMGTADIQGAALLWKTPFVVAELDATETCLSTSANCGSLVSAFSRGVFNNIDVANSGSTVSAYFESSTLTPKTTHNILPTFLIPFEAGNYAQGQQFVNQGINADNTYPVNEVYMLSTGDIDRSRARYANMGTVESLFNQTDLGTTHAVDAQFNPTGSGQMGGCVDNPGDAGTDYIANKTDVLGYHTGRFCVPQLASNTPRLGAIGDHLTSHGGNLTGAAGANQQPITDWLLDGYVASLGTIKEPWNGYDAIGEKFSKVSTLWGNYYTGQSALEAYYKSVKTPGNTTFIGEPLANPWKTSQVTYSGNTLTIKTTHIKPGETWNLQESTDGSTWTTVQSNITAPNGKYGMKTVTLPNAVTTKCYRLVNSAVTTTVKIPVTLGSVWTKTNGITNPEVCVGSGGQAQSDTTAPSAPSGVAVSGSPTETSITLDWADSTGSPAGESVFYRIRRSATSTGVYTEVGISTTSTYTNTGLTAGTTYYYKISAYDAAGNESSQMPSAGLAATTATTPTPPPPPPSSGQVQGVASMVGPSTSENVTPTANPYGATDYFVSSINGNDSNNGTSPATAWKTISRLNQLTTRPAGTRVFFHRGGRYNGAVMTYSSGTTNAPLEYGAYGSGAAPIISGATPITGTWTVDSGNVWKTTIATGLNPKYLVASGSIQTLARTPNTGWNFTDAVTGTSLTDSWVGTQATNSLVGADVVFRSSPWSWHKFPIASNSGNVIGFSGDTGNSPSFSGGYWEDTGWGYLVQDYRAGIDTPGEWYYNPTTGVLYFQAPGNVNPNTLSIEISTQDRGFAFYSMNTDIKVKNLVLEFYNYAPIYSENAKRIAVENVEIRHAPEGIHVYNQNSAGTSQANSFKNSYVHDIYSDGIWSVSTSRDVYENNVIENIGMKPELGADGLGWNFFGTRLAGDYIFKRNIVKNVGYIGISAGGSGLVEENYVENALGTLGDGAGIAFDHSNGLIMRKNIVKDIAAEMSTMPTLYPGYIPLGKGIYFGDQDILNTSVDQNIVVNVESDGIWMDHGLEYIGNSVTNNVIYGFTRSGLGAGDFSAYRDVPNQNCSPNTNSPCFKVGGYNDVVTGNKVYGLAANQNPLYHQYSYSNGTGNHTDFGTYDNNYYYNPFRANKIQKVTFFNGQTNNYTLAQWQPLAPLYDQNSTASSYTLSDTNLAADIYYNATTTATTVNVGTGGCTATGAPMAANQTIQPFSAVVVEHRVGGC